LFATGCSRTGRLEPPRYPVSGTVSLDGQPLSTGKIFFLTPSEGTIDTIPIDAGAFVGRAAAGERRIEISVEKDVPYKGPAMPGVETPATMSAETLPAVFNAESTLKAVVTPDGPNEFAFELKSPSK
jgi:hypothetical protein